MITSFEQEDAEPFSDTWEIFKLLLSKCEIYKMISVEQLTYFIDGLNIQTRMLIDGLVKGTLGTNTDEEL